MEKFNSKSVYNDLRAEAASVGCSLTDICTEAGIPRATIQNWKDKPPRSFVILEQIQDAIASKKAPKPLPLV